MESPRRSSDSGVQKALNRQAGGTHEPRSADPTDNSRASRVCLAVALRLDTQGVVRDVRDLSGNVSPAPAFVPLLGITGQGAQGVLPGATQYARLSPVS